MKKKVKKTLYDDDEKLINLHKMEFEEMNNDRLN